MAKARTISSEVWEPVGDLAPELDVKKGLGAILFRVREPARIVGWWVRPPGVKSTVSTAVQGTEVGRFGAKIGMARSFPKAVELVQGHVEACRQLEHAKAD